MNLAKPFDFGLLQVPNHCFGNFTTLFLSVLAKGHFFLIKQLFSKKNSK